MTAITLLDGGMGQELIKRSGAEPTGLWSAEVMMRSPELVRAVHLDYIRAGARVITVNAYSVTRPKLRRYGQEARFEELQRLACRLAKEAREQAREESGAEVAIAGCLPPLEWSYRPELGSDPDEVTPLYAEIAALQAPHVDLLLCETMAHSGQALGAARGAAEAGAGRPIWVAWTVEDRPTGRLRSGETITEAAARLAGLPVAARLLNCSTPEGIDAAMPDLAALGGRFGAYANGFAGISDDYGPGSTVKALSGRADLTPARYADIVMGWIGQGATIVGGCCEIGPAHIAEIARRLRAAGHEIVGPEVERA